MFSGVLPGDCTPVVYELLPRNFLFRMLQVGSRCQITAYAPCEPLWYVRSYIMYKCIVFYIIVIMYTYIWYMCLSLHSELEYPFNKFCLHVLCSGSINHEDMVHYGWCNVKQTWQRRWFQFRLSKIPIRSPRWCKSSIVMYSVQQHNNETKWVPDILILSILPSYFFS